MHNTVKPKPGSFSRYSIVLGIALCIPLLGSLSVGAEEITLLECVLGTWEVTKGNPGDERLVIRKGVWSSEESAYLLDGAWQDTLWGPYDWYDSTDLDPGSEAYMSLLGETKLIILWHDSYNYYTLKGSINVSCTTLTATLYKNFAPVTVVTLRKLSEEELREEARLQAQHYREMLERQRQERERRKQEREERQRQAQERRKQKWQRIEREWLENPGRPFGSAFLSFGFIAGTGQMLNGQPGKALLHAVVDLTTLALLPFGEGEDASHCNLGLLIAWLAWRCYSGVDAYLVADHQRREAISQDVRAEQNQ